MSEDPAAAPEQFYPAHYRRMGTALLLREQAGLKAGCFRRLVVEQELQRRRERGAILRSWLALGISAVSLGLAILALFKR